MTLNGTLEDFSPAGILKVLSSEGRTGAVRFGSHCTVYLHRGQLYFARDESTDEALATALVRPGRLTADDWAKAIEETGDRPLVGQLLVRAGAINPDLLASVVLSVMYDPLIALFHEGGSDFEFEPDTVHWLGPFRAFPVDAIVTEVRRRVREADEWSTLIPNLDVWVESRRTLPGNASQVTLLREDWELVTALTGPRTIVDLAAELGRGKYSTARVVHRLSEAGLVDVSAGTEEADIVQLRPATPTTAADEPEAAAEPDEPMAPAAPAAPAAPVGDARSRLAARPEPEAETVPEPTLGEDGGQLLSMGLPHRTPIAEATVVDGPPSISSRTEGPGGPAAVPGAFGERIGQAIAGAIADAQEDAPGFGAPASTSSLPRRGLHHAMVDHDAPWVEDARDTGPVPAVVADRAPEPAAPAPEAAAPTASTFPTPPPPRPEAELYTPPTPPPSDPVVPTAVEKNPNAAWLEDLYAQFIDEPEADNGANRRRKRNEPNPVDVAFKTAEQSGEAKISTLRRLMGALKKL